LAPFSDAVAPPAAIANTICDALSPIGIECNTTADIVQAVRSAEPNR
jgi:hypothetical protein